VQSLIRVSKQDDSLQQRLVVDLGAVNVSKSFASGWGL